MCVIEINFFLGRIVSTHSRLRRLGDAYEDSRRLSDACETSRRLRDAYGHIFKKKIIFVIFGRFKKRNPRAVGFFRRILDRNVVVYYPEASLVAQEKLHIFLPINIIEGC